MQSRVPEIFRRLPRTDCGECRHPTCLGFAKSLDAGKASIDDCPYVASVCPKCGHEAGSYFFRRCPACGISITEYQRVRDKTSTRCESCGYVSPESFQECPQCGMTVVLVSRTARKLGNTQRFEIKTKELGAQPAPEPEPLPPPKAKAGGGPRHCPYCGFVAYERLEECPQCGHRGEWFTGEE